MTSTSVTLPIHPELLERVRQRLNFSTNKQFQQASQAYIKYLLAQAGKHAGTDIARSFYETEMVRYAELAHDTTFCGATADVPADDVNDVQRLAVLDLADLAVRYGCPVPEFEPETKI
ncbi:hypothetical protein [Streptomyces fractus]|uniref:hypothetical protein n=1 Tax=Streptomyces fractus TaxID=641806 RepID=UPI003CE883E2